MTNKLNMDFETYSELDIKKVGAYKYAMHPSTEILMCSYSLNDYPVDIWDATQYEAPYTLLKWLHDSTIEIHAFNAAFERLILAYKMNMYLETKRFHCTMVQAWSLGFSGGLGEVGHQLGMSEEFLKIKEGKKLINKFCSPAPKNHKVDRYTRETSPEEWEAFKGYCVQDTVSEKEIGRLLNHYPQPEMERELWIMDQKINDRGLPIDMSIVNGAIAIHEAEKAKLLEEMNNITKLSNSNSTQQLTTWLNAHGVFTDSLDKEHLQALLDGELQPVVREVLELRQQASKTTPTKWKALQRATCDDGRLRGTFAFAGAQRTKRWAGRIFQPHNLARPSRDDTDRIAGLLATANRDLVEALYGNVMQFLVDTIRCAVTAPLGQSLAVSDLSSIESRILGWLSGCIRINNIFANGMDTYKDFATEVFHVLYEEVTKSQRHFSKPPVLGSGYGLGAVGLMGYAEGYGVEMDEEESRRITKLYREVYPEVPQMWKWLVKACEDVIQYRVTRAVGYGVSIHRDTNFLMITLPSGRSLYYYRPTIELRVPPWEEDIAKEMAELGEYYEPQKIPAITYMGMDQYTRKWKRQSTHGGKITENICQAVARDVLGYHMLMIEKDEPLMELILHVHDEAGALVPEEAAGYCLKRIEEIMSTTPPWAPGLLLGAEGFVTKRYKKD